MNSKMHVSTTIQNATYFNARFSPPNLGITRRRIVRFSIVSLVYISVFKSHSKMYLMQALTYCSASTTELPSSLKSIVDSFQAVPDSMQVRLPY